MTTMQPALRIRGVGKPVPKLGAGCWPIGGPAFNNGMPIGWDHLDPDRAYAGLVRAYELGVRMFDTADVYGMGRSERLLGQLLSEVPRDDVVVSSKVGSFAGTSIHPYTAEQLQHQIFTTMDNLNVDHLDMYFFHSDDFGPADWYLEDAIESMRMFQKDGLVSAIGMPAPHEFALQWARTDGPRSTQTQRFLYLFDKILPEVLAVRHNVLSHQYRPNETDIFAFAREHGVGVLVNQPLGQGALLRTHDQRSPRAFSVGDHRNAGPMFRAEILQAIDEGLRVVSDRFGGAVSDLARVALRCAMQVDPGAVVLVGFRDEDQMTTNLTCLGEPLSEEEIRFVRVAFSPAREQMTRLSHDAR